MKYTKENIIEGIYAKVDAMPDASEADKEFWKWKLVQYPIEVEQNVIEWVNGLPITELDCHGESIRRVLDFGGLDDTYFPSVLIGFIWFKSNDFMTNSIVYKTVYGG